MSKPFKHHLDEAKLTELAEQACTYEEIAAILEVSPDIIQRRCAAAIKKGRLKFKSSLRRLQYRTAMGYWLTKKEIVIDKVTGEKSEVEVRVKYMEPNPTMQIWLGKQYLGQSEFGAGDETDEYANFEEPKVE